MIAFQNARTILLDHSYEQPTADSSTQTSPAWHDRFLAMLPNIRRHVELRLRNLTADALEDAIAEVLAHAVANYATLVARGKEDRAFATPLADYALKAYRGGRRVGVRANSRDVTSPYCRRRTGTVVEILDSSGRESNEWQETVVEDRVAGPAEIAAIRIDFSEWLTTLTERNRSIAEVLATGECTSCVARMFNISPGRIAQLRRELSDAWSEFQGEINSAGC